MRTKILIFTQWEKTSTAVVQLSADRWHEKIEEGAEDV
jgi:hypothetical protein